MKEGCCRVQPGNSLAALPSSKVDDRPEKIWDFEHDGVHVPVPAQIVTKIQWRKAWGAYSRVLGNGMRAHRAEGVAAEDESDDKGHSAT